MSSDNTKFSISIVGGGICGLLCAIALNKAGIKVDVFEAAAQYGEVGAGVALGPNAVRVLKSFGVLDEIIACSDESAADMKTFNFIYGTDNNDFIYHYPARDDDIALGVHRAGLLDALAKFLDKKLVTEHFNKRCISVTPSTVNASRTVLHFTDGTTHETDVVIGADGIKSVVRAAVVGEETAKKSLQYTNTVAYRGLIPMEELKKKGVKMEVSPDPLVWTGYNKHFITFPIKQERILNVVAFVSDNTIPIGATSLPPHAPWVEQVPQQELIAAYSDWSDDAKKILECIKEPAKWSIHNMNPPLESYAKGRVVLIGDSAHAMLPHLGSGVGQGIEDTYVLTQLLTHPETNLSNIEAVFQAYSRLRVPRATFVLQSSTRAGRIYESFGPSGYTKEGIRKDFANMYEQIWHHDLQGDVDEALAKLREEKAFAPY
ncbi:FAD/NAD-P-binding domain-containing protein [Stereum hirsutum FP-91666 SS1]|uniref:FAD/NAD-P-binding domain-containing protein n=1 Tax=Stereum hirsutum (strain FP-91666) TaxID=721885 RepID=UPI0004449533|nr:FAD/NAD-P-binding domain-containing protein [Stereum hirsutum FP-91666 SS1]EIM86775.1 FAD/NAD-P-binding domain-containing protein [Stereum hirsutum FP-91666 SS1]